MICALKSLAVQYPFSGVISIVSASSSCCLSLMLSFVSIMFSVPGYGVRPSFCLIWLSTHGNSVSLVPSPFPVETFPCRQSVCVWCGLPSSENK